MQLQHKFLTIIMVFAVFVLCTPSILLAQSQSMKRALLIGVSDYTGTGLNSLEGVKNDIELTQQLLANERYAFAEDMTVLLNEQASHSGLQLAFEELADRVVQGDIVYIHYSGHGSFTRDLNDDESSGYDQTWVSFGARNPVTQGIDAYDVLDDELNEWLVPIFNKAAQVIMVSDSCHSGSVTRGTSVLLRAAPRDDRPHPLGKQVFQSADLNNGIIIGAARDNEAAGEFFNPEQGSYGLFSWHWALALENVKEGETWRDLFSRAAIKVKQQRKEQTPQIRGELIDQPVFGGEVISASPRIPVRDFLAASGMVSLPVGSLSGVTVGSVYQRYSLESETHADQIEITLVYPFFCIGKTSATFAVGDLVTEVDHAYSVATVAVYVEPNGAEQLGDKLIAALQSERFGGYVYVNSAQHSQMIFSVASTDTDEGETVRILTDLGQLWHEELQFNFTDYATGEGQLGEALRKISRTKEIVALQSEVAPNFIVHTALWSPTEYCQQDLPSCMYVPPIEAFFTLDRQTTLHELVQTPPTFGQILTFSIENSSDENYYAYLIDIGPSGGVFTVYPNRSFAADDAIVRAGKTRHLGERSLVLLNEDGLETFKLLVSRKPINIALLEQSGFTNSVGTRGGGASPLENLLNDAMHGTRGAAYSIPASEWGANNYAFEVGDK